MGQLAQTCGQSIADFSQGLRFPQVAKQHRNQLFPPEKSFGPFVAAILSNNLLKLYSIDVAYDLSENTRTFACRVTLQFVGRLG